MPASRVLSRISRSIPKSSLFIQSSAQKYPLPILSNQLHSLVFDSPDKLITSEGSLLNRSAPRIFTLQRFAISSSASPQPSVKEDGETVEKNGAKTSEDPEKEKPVSEDEGDLEMDDLVKLVAEKEELLKIKNKEMETMKDKFLRSCAEMENVNSRIKREAENSKKFAIQNFAKGLLDVADNLGRASSVAKDSFSKIDSSNDTSGAAPLLRTLLEGVEMTEKQLAKVLKNFGVEKYDPTDEVFDPHRHNAVFQMADGSKPPGTVAVVLKAGYMLHDRVIRPAEVGVTQG